MRRTKKDIMMMVLGAAAVVYLINPTFGIFELLPDNLPLIGNIDEAAATTLFIGVLSYFGITLPRIFQRPSQEQKDDRSIKDADVL